MKGLLIISSLVSFMLLIGACSSSQKQSERTPPPSDDTLSLIRTEPPAASQKIKPVPVYVDQVTRLEEHDPPGLLIRGSLPNGCAKLGRVHHQTTRNGTVKLVFDGWQPPDVACTQALKPFNYLYTGLTADSLETIERVQVGDQIFTL